MIPPHVAVRPGNYPSREQLEPVWAAFAGRPVAAMDVRDWPSDPPFCATCGEEMLTIGNLEIEGRPEWHSDESLNLQPEDES